MPADEEASDVAVGRLLAGRYRIVRRIARGGMAVVYLARQENLSRHVAVKVLTAPPNPDDIADFQQRFRLEAETLASLDHPNIVVLHDFGELPNGGFYLAMEYIDGLRLADVAKDGPLEPDRVLGLVHQIARALRYAHQRGVVHRDLKPSNLLVTRRDDGSERVKVVDFGLVKLTESDQDITRAGLILGSPHCMSPEQIKGLDVDPRADIYSLGVLMYRLLTATYPFHGPHGAATMIAHLNEPIPTFASTAPHLTIPPAVEHIVRTCLAKHPEGRYADVSALLADLERCTELPPHGFPTASTIRPAILREEPRQKYLVPLLVVSTLVALFSLVALTGVLYTVLSPRPVPPPRPAIPVARPSMKPSAPLLVPTDAVPTEVPKPKPVTSPAPPPRPVAARPEPPPPPVNRVPSPPPSPAPVAVPKPKPKPSGYLGLPEDF